MKKTLLIIAVFMGLLTTLNSSAQTIPDNSKIDSNKVYLITKNDGTQFEGKILHMDPKEVLIDTKRIGQVSVPKHEIKEIREVRANEITAKGEYKPSETFATRYFLTTNGFPIEKGESYILWNLYGPDMEFGVAKNFGVGIMTTWLGTPAIATAKYSIELDKNTHMAVGTLLGTGSWALPHLGIALPFTSLTYGNRRNNITFSGGYGAIWGYGANGGRVLCSVAGMAQISKKASFVFDSFILPGNADHSYTAIYIPGLRFQTASNKAFQFGFAGVASNGGFTPIPMIQWFRML